ncbi:hypothetical protein ABW20_dc0109021 [Dactylellina cionopaga]|nr:hypothetical protein ABW20_dc0109021 [Dactylellina cionopaga]
MKVSACVSTPIMLFALGVPGAVQAGGFRGTCNDPIYQDTVLSARCRELNGQEVASSINLNDLIVNNICRINSQSNNDCGLICECNTPDEWKWTSIDLNNFINNRDGFLTWDN